MRQHHLKRRSVLPFLLAVLWLGGAVKGMTVLWDYQNRPGKVGVPPVRWPIASRVPRPTDRAMLVMAVHPHCPCSRASLSELALLMTRLHGRISACVLFYKPSGFRDDWVKTDLWQSAGAIPGVAVRYDTDGREALRFGALTSGQTLVYDASGSLLFSGGITAARGHQGDSTGFEAIVSRVRHGSKERSSAPVFGCSLGSEEVAWHR